MSIVLRNFCLKSGLKPGSLYTGVLFSVWVLLGFSLPAGAERAIEPQLDLAQAQTSPFDGGVKAYRAGDYRQAHKLFSALHRQSPGDTKFTYYLAITEAQLGRFQQSKSLYREIITLDPNGEAATLAKEGLKYLPPETSLDLPPRFNQSAGEGHDDKPATQPPATATTGQPATTNMAPSMSPQDLMAWQMMMGQNNGNGMGGNNPMGGFIPNMMMGNGNAPNGGAGGMSGFDPSMMGTMMMNQMMQNVNVGGDQNENH
jgi:hypothetical protein